MEVKAVDPLELESLPSDPRVMALRLLGMTAAEMKEIDKNIVGSSNNISGLKLSVDKMVSEINNTLTPQQIAPAPHSSTQQIPIAQVSNEIPVQQIPTPKLQQEENKPFYDPNQLEFDFYKKLTPEDLLEQLKTINKNIKNLELKLDSILETIEQKKN